MELIKSLSGFVMLTLKKERTVGKANKIEALDQPTLLNLVEIQDGK